MIEKIQMLNADHSEGQCNLVGVIGLPGPIAATPELYNAAFGALDMNWSCVLLPANRGKLRDALLGLRALGFVGAEVGDIFQAEALACLEELTPAARDIGLVNLIEVTSNGSLVGDNTQWRGFMTSLRANARALPCARPAVIGAGAAAHSVVYALAREGLPLTIVDQDIERAIDLVHNLRHVMDEHSFSIYRSPHDLELLGNMPDLIVNTTDIGAWPAADASPWPDGLPIPPSSLVYDLVPWPAETAFLRHAKRCGARTVSGLAMLVYQAALIFERWTRRSPPIREMWRVGTRVLQRRGTMLPVQRPTVTADYPTRAEPEWDSQQVRSVGTDFAPVTECFSPIRSCREARVRSPDAQSALMRPAR